jgi:hypothetical protein
LALDSELTKVGEFEQDQGRQPWSEQLRARGKRAFMTSAGELRVFDTSDAEKPVSYAKEMNDWGCSALEVRGSTALCAQGKRGVQLFLPM